MKVVYGLFEDSDKARHAAATLADSDAPMVHSGHVREEDIPLGGTDATRWAVIGAVSVGLVGALASAFLVWPTAGHEFGMAAALFAGIGGAVFGLIAGAVAGASECKPAIADAAARIDKRGGALVMCELDDNDDVKRVVDALRAEGGTQVEAA